MEAMQRAAEARVLEERASADGARARVAELEAELALRPRAPPPIDLVE